METKTLNALSVNEKQQELQYNIERYTFLREIFQDCSYTLPQSFLLKEFMGWDDEKIKTVTKLYKSQLRKFRNSRRSKCGNIKSCCDIHEMAEDLPTE